MAPPRSFAPRSRLIAERTSPPKNPARQMSSAIAAVCEGLKGGGTHQRAVLMSTVEVIPPTVPSRVLWGLTPGATGLFPAGFSPDILEDVAELHRQDKEEKQVGVFSLKTRNGGASSIGMWLTASTQMRSAHWVRAVLMRKFFDSPVRTRRMGIKTNA